MTEPAWKKYLSYLLELHIESASSEYNPHLYVSLRKGRYQLSTANAVYSFGDLYSNFSRTFDRWNWQQHPVNNVLLLGLGLGSIPVILEQTHQQDCHYTAVEIDEAIVDMAYRYVLKGLDSAVEMIVADAAIAVQQLPQKSYDLICVDIFDDDVVPKVFEQTEFLQSARALLQSNGVLLFNRLAANPEDWEASHRFYDETFRAVFPQSHCLDVGGNFILVSDKRAIGL